MNQKFFIMAPPGTGKTTAAQKQPDKIADVDWGFWSRIFPNWDKENNRWLNSKHDGKITRNPDYPANYVRNIASAFETHSIVVTPTSDIPIALIRLIKSETLDVNAIKQFIKIALQNTLNWVDETLSAEEFSVECERLFSELMPELERLKSMEFESVLTIADYENINDLTNDKWDKNPRVRSLFGEREKFKASIAADIRFSEKLYNESGLFSKLPMHKGQLYFENALDNEIIKPRKQRQSQITQIQNNNDYQL